jgi:pyridoxamine 5'-phosphate oxidase
MDIKPLRKDYQSKLLDRKDLLENPFEQFQNWFQEAIKAGVEEANAMALATTSSKGQPSCRIVLMKDFGPEGLLFFTNYESHKAHDLLENPWAAVTFFWRELHRQVCIQGKVEKTTQKVSEEYFSARPRKSQLAAWCSRQSEPVSSRDALEIEFRHFEKLYQGIDVPLPPFWGGFRLIPSRFEFWQGRENRLHDRFSYTLDKHQWLIERLFP